MWTSKIYVSIMQAIYIGEIASFKKHKYRAYFKLKKIKRIIKIII